MAGPADRPRATRWETLGARLGVWTLPVGVEDPPPIRRRSILLGDARARVVAGKLDGPIHGVRCSPSVDDGGGDRVRLDCLAMTSAPAAGGAATATAGHPFLVSGSLRGGRYAWCKMNAPPGEGASATGVIVSLPDACTR